MGGVGSPSRVAVGVTHWVAQSSRRRRQPPPDPAESITKERAGNLVTVDTGVLPGFHAAGEAHTAVLTYKDSTGAFSRTNQWTFYNLENLILPASPVTGENFDSYPEATDPTTAAPPAIALITFGASSTISTTGTRTGRFALTARTFSSGCFKIPATKTATR